MKEKPKISVQDLHLYYGENHALKGISMDIRKNAVTAFIGPSGCGKSTFLKTMNRMNDLVDGVKIEGKILLDGEDIYAPDVDTTILRKRASMTTSRTAPGCTGLKTEGNWMRSWKKVCAGLLFLTK